MKIWNLNIESYPKEISDKLESALNDRFVLKVNHDKDNSLTFRLRKRILYIWYMYFHNWTIVNGKLLKADTDEKTNVEISFTQHWFILMIIYSQMILGLGFIVAMALGFSSSTSMYIPGGILLALGVILWIVVRMKFKKDIQEYKTLLSEILGF